MTEHLPTTGHTVPAEPAGSAAVAITAAHELSARGYEHARRIVWPRVLGLLAAAPDTELSLSFEADQRGTIAGLVEITGGPLSDPEEVLTAIARALAPVYTTTPAHTPAAPPVDQDGGHVMVWGLSRMEGLGLDLDLDFGGFPVAAGRELLEALVLAPGYRVRLCARSTTALSVQGLPCLDLRLELTAPTRSTHLPLELRAVMDRVLPGHRTGPGDGGFRLSFIDAQVLPVLPVAAGAPLPGMATAETATIAVRHRPGKTEPITGPLLGTLHYPSGAPGAAVLGEAEQLRHVHVTGRTGTGKSSLLTSMAVTAAAAGQGMVVLDPHGELVERIANTLPHTALERTVMIRSGDLQHPIPINPLATTDPVEQDLAIAELIAAFYTIFDPRHEGIIGPRFEQVMAMSLRTLIAYRGTRASLLEVPRLLTDPGFARRARAAVTDPAVTGFWANHDRSQTSNDHGELISWVTSKWERFTTTAAVRAVLGSGQDTLEMTTAMDTNAIVLIDLSTADLGSMAAELLGYLHLTRIWTATRRRTNRTPFTVIVDEAQSFMAGALPTMLAEGRKFGLSVVIAHQHLAQLPPALSAALAGNTATQIAFRAGRPDAETLCARMGGHHHPPTLTELPDLTALVQRTGGNTTTHPFTIHVHQQPPRTTAASSATGLEDLLTKTHCLFGTRNHGPDPDAVAAEEEQRQQKEKFERLRQERLARATPHERTTTAPPGALATGAALLEDYRRRIHTTSD
ncbi:type IV secretion system DNA-binding domain-containing protein [Kocuria sp. CPCC 205268]|uniref:type IV secretory system conjugative DNA transfer family protein n=1 Tax=Kocuria oxytropis TaxID=3058913 RepID=UPI0034D7B342